MKAAPSGEVGQTQRIVRKVQVNGLVDNLPIRSLSILTAGVKSANVESEIVNAVNKRSLFQTLKIIIRLMRKK